MLNVELLMLNGIQKQSTNYEIQITNALGEEVFRTSSFINSNFQIDVSNRPEGIYFVTVKSKENSVKKKIIIHR